MIEVVMRGRIRWADADAAGRLHFPRIFEYFEDGENELLRQAGFDYSIAGREYDFPRVNVECSFKRVLALYAPFFMRVTVGRLGRSSIRYEYRIYADEQMQELACEGSMTVVAAKDGKAVPIPEKLRALLAGER